MNVAVTAPHLPELPRVYVDTTYTTPSGSTVNVSNGTELQAALTAAVGGQIIRVALGNYSGAFTLPNIAGSTYVYVVSANLASLPATGVRVGLADAANMPKITSPGSNGSALATAGVVAHHFRFVGIEFTCPSGDSQSGLIRFGTGAETDVSQFPHHLILDRCIVHGDATTGGRRGIILAGNHLAVIDSYIYDWWKTDSQCQGIAGWTGEGPWAVKNCYVSADAENMMVGGSDTSIVGLIPSDIEVINNLFSKPLTWNPNHASWDLITRNVANLFELKTGRRVLIVENTFEHNWPAVQAGRAIVFTTKSQEGVAYWTAVEDVTFINNVIDGVHSCFSISGNDGGYPSAGGRRIRIHNNFMHDIGGAAWGEGGGTPSTIFNMSSGMQYVTIQHNTIIHGPFDAMGLLITASGSVTFDDFRFLDNICEHNTFGIKGPSYAVGNETLAAWFPSCLFQKNVLVGGSAASYPSNNYFPAAKTDVGFRNPASDYRLDPTSTPLGDLSTGLTAFHDLSNANDTVGTNHLTLGVPPAYFTDGAYFTGTAGQYLAIADNADMSTGDIDWTYNIWVNGSNLSHSGGFPFIASKGWIMPVDAQSEWGLAQNGTGQPLVFAVAFGTAATSVVNTHGGALTSGTLYMVTIWHSATLNQIGICLHGGIADPTADTTSYSAGMNNGNRAFSIGARSDGTLTWDGALAKGTFYKGRVLTAPQITDLYNAGVPLSLATMQAGVLNTCPYYTVASDGGPVGAPDSVIETLP